MNIEGLPTLYNESKTNAFRQDTEGNYTFGIIKLWYNNLTEKHLGSINKNTNWLNEIITIILTPAKKLSVSKRISNNNPKIL